MKILGLIEIDSKGISIPLVKIHIPFQLAIPILIFFAKPATAVRTTVTALHEGVPCSARIAGDITNDGIKDLVVSCNEDTTPWSCLRYSQAENSMIPFSNTYINEPLPSNYFYLTTQAARDLMSDTIISYIKSGDIKNTAENLNRITKEQFLEKRSDLVKAAAKIVDPEKQAEVLGFIVERLKNKPANKL